LCFEGVSGLIDDHHGVTWASGVPFKEGILQESEQAGKESLSNSPEEKKKEGQAQARMIRRQQNEQMAHVN
jgi:hypothetical protein